MFSPVGTLRAHYRCVLRWQAGRVVIVKTDNGYFSRRPHFPRSNVAIVEIDSISVVSASAYVGLWLLYTICWLGSILAVPGAKTLVTFGVPTVIFFGLNTYGIHFSSEEEDWNAIPRAVISIGLLGMVIVEFNAVMSSRRHVMITREDPNNATLRRIELRVGC